MLDFPEAMETEAPDAESGADADAAEADSEAPRNPRKRNHGPGRRKQPAAKRTAAKAKAVAKAKIPAKEKAKAKSKAKATPKAKKIAAPGSRRRKAKAKKAEEEADLSLEGIVHDESQTNIAYAFGLSTDRRPIQKNTAEGEGVDGAEKSGEPGEPTDNQPAKEASSSSSSSSSSRSSSSAPDVALGEMEDDDTVLERKNPKDGGVEGDATPNSMLLAETTRTRSDVFRYHFRHVRRIWDHFGPDHVERIAQRLNQMTLVSLYSGLGGAEISAKLLATAVPHVLREKVARGQTNEAQQGDEFDSIKPEFLLCCDKNKDCREILKSHSVPWLPNTSTVSFE